MTEPLDELLAAAHDRGASDLYVTVGAPPLLSVDKELVPAGDRPLARADVERLLAPVLTPERAARFAAKPELDVSREVPGKGRFRLNVYRQRGQPALVARHVKQRIASARELGLPPVLERLALERRGLLLVTGAAGSGKSTTLAALIEHRTASAPGHVVTIEDPIEFVFPHRKAIVSQREVGVDTQSFHDALRSCLRQAPDVLLIGEVRDRETAEAALHLAETGHLVLATLHSTNAVQAIERLATLFPSDAHAQLLLLASLTLIGVVSQRLVPRKGGGRVAALEILLPTERVREAIKRGDTDSVKAALREGGEGMQAFDEALYQLIRAGRLDAAAAAPHADQPGDLLLRLRLEDRTEPGHGGMKLV